MIGKHLARHNKLASITFHEQPEEFDLAQTGLVQTVEFDYFLPVSFVLQSYIPSRKGYSQV
jgi:hypothetical protein